MPSAPKARLEAAVDPGADLYRALCDGLEDGLIAIDAQGRVLHVNPAALDLCELGAGAMLGRPLSAVGAAGAALGVLGERAFAENRAVHGELAWPRHLGPPRLLEARAMPRLGAERRALGVTLLLRERPDALGLAGELRGDGALYATLAAGIAHEVRNPLGGIRGAVQLLDAELSLDSPLREHAGVALREVDRLASLVERLLDLGRPAALGRVAVNLHALLDEVLATAERDPRARGVRFERRYDPSLPDVVGDAASLGRVFHNLVRNAVEASAGRGAVRISTGVETGVRVASLPSANSGRRAPAGVVRVTFADEGPGVPPAVQARLFLPFASGKPGGTGLGLALARKVAADHGGWIVHASEPGRGATFIVYLPVGAPDERRP